jgi:hypothetical protein
MGTLAVNTFSSYAMSREETLHSQILNFEQKQNIQNLICEKAEEKLALTFDPLNPVRFAQEEAGLAGMIGILRYLIESSDASEAEVLAATQSNEAL